ncbi:MAG: PTS sugar transporter subunit IIB [Deltaproteobacteria bacterium]|nr:MAG: PTS sugar transporter subunit IIB [Deltaproteobacteria bacterium]
MAIVLARIDSRLIHGQVLEAWVPYVKADCIVVANDAAARTPLQRMIMQAAVPRDIRLEIDTLEEAVALLASPELAGKRILLLFASSDDALQVRRLGVDFVKLNLGNMHAADGKCRYSCTIALDQHDIDNLRAIEAFGVTIMAQCVPADREQGWGILVRSGGA